MMTDPSRPPVPISNAWCSPGKPGPASVTSPTHDDESLPDSPPTASPLKARPQGAPGAGGAFRQGPLALGGGGDDGDDDDDDDESLPPSPPHSPPEWHEPAVAAGPVAAGPAPALARHSDASAFQPGAAVAAPAGPPAAVAPTVGLPTTGVSAAAVLAGLAGAGAGEASGGGDDDDDDEDVDVDEIIPVPKTGHIELDEEIGTDDLDLRARSASFSQATQQCPPDVGASQHKALTMWKGLQEHVKSMRGGRARQGCTWYNNVVRGSALVSYVLAYLRQRPEEKYQNATRQQATGIAQMLADQAMLIPANDYAQDGVSDNGRCLFYISGVAAEGAVGLA